MTSPRQPAAALSQLDVLLRQQPLPVAEPTNAEWESKLELTMQRVRALSPRSEVNSDVGTSPPPNQPTLAFDSDDTLRTPLPVEAGEPEPSDPYAFEAEQGGLYDELLAPLESGEHAPLRLANHAQAASAAPPRRRALVWLSASVGSLAAAAAVLVSLHRTSLEPAGPAVTMNIGSAAVASAGQAAPQLAAAMARPEELALDDAVQSPTPPPVAMRPGNAVVRERRAAAPAAAAAPAMAAKSANEKDEAQLEPASGPSHLGDHPSTGEVSAALSRRIQEAQRCLPPAAQSTGVRLTFQSDGTVRQVEILNSTLGSDPRACLQRALGAVRVEPFARDQFHVNATISRPVSAAAPQPPR